MPQELRSSKSRRTLAGCVLGLLALASWAEAAVISRDLERAMASRGTHADTAIIVRFVDPIDLGSLTVTDRRARDGRIVVALQRSAQRHRAALEPWLAAEGAQGIRDLWIINGLAATLPAVAVRKLAADPGIARIDLDSFVQGGRPQRLPTLRTPMLGELPRTAGGPPASSAAPTAGQPPGWNVAAVHAPELWAMGHTGRGSVVATMDTGADLEHPQLGSRWRGGSNSWFDPHGELASPYDALGHGTQALGVVLGGPEIGIAPDARWIAVRLFDGKGHARMSDIHRAFQWLLDPDGDPTTADAPDVVNASWALSGRVTGTCVMEFDDDIRALKSAGVAVVLAAGNDGPAAGTSNSPANNPGVLSVGAVDRDLVIGRQTSRGPSACDGAVFPALSAPGIDIRTTDLSHGGQPSYAVVSGSSLAAPHAAGVLALLAAALPSASVAQLEAALLKGARDLGPPGPDNVYGHGLVDALAAYKALEPSVAAAAGSGSAHGPELGLPRPEVARVAETSAPAAVTGAAPVVGRP
jgi:bacillopeptidase F